MLFENLTRWTMPLRLVVSVIAFGSASIVPAWAQADSSLEWTVETDGAAMTVQRAKGEMLWRGETLAEITYWDESGAEHPQPVTAGKGWTIESQSLATGRALTYRHETLGFTLRFVFAVNGDVLTVSVPAESISESGNARLKTLRLFPRFGAANEGDEGYLVIAQQSGALCRFRGKRPAEHVVSVYQSICQCPMPLFGAVCAGGGMAGIVTGGQYDSKFCVSTAWGPKKQYAIDPTFTLRSFRDEPRLPDDLTVEYHFLPETKASWADVAKCYREYNFTHRGIRPLRQRATDSPGLAYSAGALQVRIRQGVKPVPYKIKEQTPENEPPMRVFCRFAQVRDIFDEFYRQGIKRAEFCLVGWNRGGHDGRYPQIFPVEPALGGEAELRKTIRHGQSLGYQVVAHDCYYGAYRISDEWSEDYLRKTHDGGLKKGGIWGGGQSYNICLTLADELFARRDLPRIRELGFQGVHYTDVLSILGPRPCYDPRHPETRRQDAEAAVRILARAQKVFGGSQSEGSLDFTAPALDRLMYIDCDKWSPLAKKPYVDTRVPLYQTVYHGVLVYNLSTEVVNTLPGEDGYLRNIEYGGSPLIYFYGHFLLDEKKNWLGQRDYRYDDRKGLEQAVAGLRRVSDDFQRLGHLQMEFLEGHRQLADGVFETTYGNGQRVVVNYGKIPHSLSTGQAVPPRSYLLIGTVGEQSHDRRDRKTKASNAPKNLIVPPESETETSITLLWDPPSDDERGLSYEVYCDSVNVGTVTKTFHTVTGLTPDTTYSFSVRAKDADGELSAAGNEVSHSTKKKGDVFNVVDYGAVGDGVTKNTKAIQKAIDACTPGGTVHVPAGTFVSGALFLKSNMTLHIAKGGTLKGSAGVDDYRPFIRNRYSGWEMETFASLINAGTLAHDGSYNVKSLTIRGEGTISGGGAALGKAMLDAEGYYSRARLICLMNCEGVNIQGLTLENSPSWTLHYTYCRNVTCHGLTIVSEGIRNGDGIDPDSSVDSYIFDCNISTSDDCIAIKSGKNPEGNRIGQPTENILIAHCKFRGHGMSIGSEMSGGVGNVTVRDCEIAKDDLNGLQIKAPKERGGYVRNIRVVNCTLSQIKIITKIRYNTDYEPAPEAPFLGDMEFANLNMTNAVTGKPAIVVDGFEGAEKNTANIRFKNIRVADGTQVSVKNATDISFRDVLTAGGDNPVYHVKDAEGISY